MKVRTYFSRSVILLSSLLIGWCFYAAKESRDDLFVIVMLFVVATGIMLAISLIAYFALNGEVGFWTIFMYLPTIFATLIIIFILFYFLQEIYFSSPKSIEEYRANESIQTIENSSVTTADSVALQVNKNSPLLYKESIFYYQKTVERPNGYLSYFFFKANQKKAPMEFLLLQLNKDFEVLLPPKKDVVASDAMAKKIYDDYLHQEELFEELGKHSDTTTTLSREQLKQIHDKVHIESGIDIDTL